MFQSWTHTKKNKWRYYPSHKIINLMVEVYLEEKGAWTLARVMSSMESMDGNIDLVALQTYPDPDNLKDTVDSEYPQLSVRSPLLRLPNGAIHYFNVNEDIEMTNLGPLYDRPIGPDLPGPTGPYSKLVKDDKVSIHFRIPEEFIRLGGHKYLIDRIQDHENPLPVTILMKFIDFSVCLSQYIRSYEKKDSELHNFGENMVGIIEDFVKNDLINASIKEFQFTYFSNIQTAINKFKLGKSFDERKIFLLIEIALRCLNCAYLSVRVQGCKEIENRCSTAHRTNASTIKLEDMAEWMSNNHVISSIFGTNHHSELIGRSEYILKVLSRSKIGLKEEEIKLIWNLTNRDKQTKKEIYKILQKVGDLLGKEFIEFIFQKIKEFDYLSSTDLSFLYSFKKNTDFQLE